jgi:hypothetical protein
MAGRGVLENLYLRSTFGIGDRSRVQKPATASSLNVKRKLPATGRGSTVERVTFNSGLFDCVTLLLKISLYCSQPVDNFSFVDFCSIANHAQRQFGASRQFFAHGRLLNC